MEEFKWARIYDFRPVALKSLIIKRFKTSLDLTLKDAILYLLNLVYKHLGGKKTNKQQTN